MKLYYIQRSNVFSKSALAEKSQLSVSSHNTQPTGHNFLEILEIIMFRRKVFPRHFFENFSRVLVEFKFLRKI